MPSTYAHRRFGADVLERLPAELQEKIAPYRELYDIGLHGPDLLFYYHAAKSTPVSALGNAMHEQPGAVFFERARGVVNKAKNRDAALAYALGFLCHFALDSTCHPRVEQDVRDSGVSHCEIETEFDNMLLRRDGKAGESDRAVLSGHHHFAGLRRHERDGGRAQAAAGLQPGQALGGADRHESRGQVRGPARAGGKPAAQPRLRGEL